MYKIERKVNGTRVLFFVTLNDQRISRTNFARKYDAVNQVKNHKTWTATKVAA